LDKIALQDIASMSNGLGLAGELREERGEEDDERSNRQSRAGCPADSAMNSLPIEASAISP
jgi:hypothetical protein